MLYVCMLVLELELKYAFYHSSDARVGISDGKKYNTTIKI